MWAFLRGSVEGIRDPDVAVVLRKSSPSIGRTWDREEEAPVGFAGVSFGFRAVDEQVAVMVMDRGLGS
ncbi:MAG: hypothetical protein CMJ28_07325 [Phycisphaerae bacterium]|nr:hypothetical protein [Phycisphaerae bacterium]